MKTPLTDKADKECLTDADLLKACRNIEIKFNNLQNKVLKWYEMSPQQMRLQCGEMSAQEIRSIKAVLKNIIESVD